MDDLMAWALQDDGFYDHPKVLELLDSGLDGAAAIGLWTLALGWAKKKVDPAQPDRAGLIPASMPRRLVGEHGDKLAALLVEARAGHEHGLWEANGSGWRIHDFAYWQQLEQWAKRSEQARRAVNSRWQQSRARQFTSDGQADDQREYTDVDTGESTGVDTGEGSGVDTGAIPTSPNLTSPEVEANASTSRRRSKSAPGTDLEVTRPEVAELASLLAEWVARNDPNGKRPNVTQTWLNDIRLMIDVDGRQPGQIRAAIEWCQRHEFWHANIKSPAKLRKQYATLQNQAGRDARAGSSTADQRVRETLARAERYRSEGR
jgi:hypothetical protein